MVLSESEVIIPVFPRFLSFSQLQFLFQVISLSPWGLPSACLSSFQMFNFHIRFNIEILDYARRIFETFFIFCNIDVMQLVFVWSSQIIKREQVWEYFSFLLPEQK